MLPTDYVLLDRYLAGECTPAERQIIERRIATDPDWRQRVEDTHLVRQHGKRSAEPRHDTQALWRSLTNDLGLAPPGGERIRKAPGIVGSHYAGTSLARWGWAAAAVACVLVVAGGIWRLATPSLVPTHGFAVREFATAVGGRAKVTLRDGTQLTLGPASHLRVPADFGYRSRTLELDGEALFAVVHDARRPFSVHTAYGVVRDVGTVFDVRAYTADHDAQVAVAEGVVAVAGTALFARDVARLDAGGHLTALRRNLDVSAWTAWAQGALVFRDTPFQDVVRTLSRRFNLDITVADSTLVGQNVTASFTDEDVDVILSDITAIAGAEYRRNGRTVVIRLSKEKPVRTQPASAPRPLVTAAGQRDPHE